jgi:enterochelin esterase-like enzyme
MMNFWQTPLETLQAMFGRKAPLVRQLRHIKSPILGREVDLDIYLPPNYNTHRDRRYPLLLLNDGQDLPRMHFSQILKKIYEEKRLPYVIVVGIYCSHDRMREYGTARQPDYKGRGDRAKLYHNFIMVELLPFLRHRFRTSESRDETVFGGFSLGGLSALDIALANPQAFGAAGVFSGALWWRWSVVDPRNPDADRIMHDIIYTAGNISPHTQRFWFQTGTLDENEDRNNNGVIDAIDDTLDCMRALRYRGCHEEQLRYVELLNGTHDPQTWGIAMPDFLAWMFSTGWKFQD